MFDTSERGLAVMETLRRVEAGEPATAEELVDTFRWVEETQARLEAARLSVVNDLAYRPTIGDPDQPQAQRTDAVPAVLRAELGWGKVKSSSYDELAYRLCEHLHATHQALRDGLISESVAQAISDGLAGLTPTQQAQLEAKVLGWIRQQLENQNLRVTAARVRRWLERETIKLDPDAAKDRHREKTSRRDLQLLPDVDSTADLEIYNLPADQARLVYDHIDALAHQAKRAGDDRRLGQLRADIAVELLSGHSPYTHCTHGPCPHHTDGEPDQHEQPGQHKQDQQPEPGQRERGRCGRSCGGPSGRGSFVLYVSLAELLALRDEPGELGGYGPVIRDIAQRLVAMGIDDPDAVYDVAVTNSRGQVIGLHGVNKRLFTGKLRDLVNATWRRCTFPAGCNRPAHTCEVDHSRDWANGGLTSAGNANPICGIDHHQKTENGWTQERPDPTTGEIVWRSPFGQTYRMLPEPLVDPDPEPSGDIDDQVRDETDHQADRQADQPDNDPNDDPPPF